MHPNVGQMRRAESWGQAFFHTCRAIYGAMNEDEMKEAHEKLLVLSVIVLVIAAIVMAFRRDAELRSER